MFYAKCKLCNNNIEYKWKKSASAAERAGRVCKECKYRNKNSLVFTRVCPICKETLKYKQKDAMQRLDGRGSPCRACISKKRRTDNYSGLKRQCPGCKKTLSYAKADSCTRANKANSMCKSCALKESGVGPTPQCIEASIKAKLGKKQTIGHRNKIINSNIKKFGQKSYLQSTHFKKTMLEKGVIRHIHGKTPNAWAEAGSIPRVAFYKWLSRVGSPTIDEIINFCENYEVRQSSIENILSNNLNLPFWNKRLNQNLKYRPDFKLSDKVALNVDGLYWHSECAQKDKNYHFKMREEYEAQNIRIIQFREDEVYNKINIIKSMIDNLNNKISNKVGARKTSIKILNSSEARLFLEENHMKGHIHSNHIGLYYKDILILIMSYKRGKNKKGTFIKIDRFCSKTGYNVAGGFSKLLKYVENNNLETMPIHYWVDLRYGTGNFLLNNGFYLEKETLGWEWTDFNKTYNRLRCRANMDDRSFSEKEHAKELGWHRIYDAGQRLYVK